jgi:BMFP domain-containing protein YqiC
VRVLHQGKGNFVLGNDYARWHKPDEVLPILSGEQEVLELTDGWELLRSPLPPVNSTADSPVRQLYSAIRQDLGLAPRQFEAGKLADLDIGTRQDFELELDRRVANAPFFQRENPFVRHVVLRKRTTLEDAGLLKRVGVDVHPDGKRVKDIHAFNALFEGLAVRTDEHFREAYNQARLFGKVLGKRGKGGGFMKNLMQQRICSSLVAGINTATALLKGLTLHEEFDDIEEDVALQTDEERAALEQLLHRLKQIDSDPKFEAVLHFLINEGWLEHGCIIFSQYYDTARWLADGLAAHFPNEAIGLYAGAGRSRLYQSGDSVGIERETLKVKVAEHEIRLMVATDAACEGLNLQTLGTLINIDLPWNPTRLEQRIGRIKRFGQVRDSVDMLNLVNEQTVDEKVYERLSERMRDKFNLFGSLPDTIKDDWIEDIETLDEKMDQYIDDQKRATGFDLRYNAHLAASDKDWRDCAEVLSQRDFGTLMREGWEK